MKLTSAGESHGKALIGIIENVPSNLKIDFAEINEYLSLRQSGYGRGDRQAIEKDTISVLSGIRNGYTLGSPIAFLIENKDSANWADIMDAKKADISRRTVTKVRPGHADLTGMIKYGHNDARNILERASARETAVRVAAGTVARQFLARLGVRVAGYVKSICGVTDENTYEFERLNDCRNSELFMLDKDTEKRAVDKITELKKQGDTCGGVVQVRVKGLKSGFGSCMQYDKKLDAIISGSLFSVQAVKGVEFGLGFKYAERAGSDSHDEIYYDDKFYRKTNNAGGIEGGMSSGEEIVINIAKKSIPTLMRGLNTVDFLTKEKVKADTERSDVTAVPAFEIICESVLSLVIAEAVLERLGSGNMDELIKRYDDLP